MTPHPPAWIRANLGLAYVMHGDNRAFTQLAAALRAEPGSVRAPWLWCCTMSGQGSQGLRGNGRAACSRLIQDSARRTGRPRPATEIPNFIGA